MAEVQLNDAPPGLRTFYDKGVAAMERSNFDYAMDMFEAALAEEPRILEIRKLLRSAAVQKIKDSPPGKLATAKKITRLMKAASRIKKDPIQALALTEKLLRDDPFNLKFVKVHCEAAEAAELPEVAILTLELLNKHRPATLAVLEPLAKLYAQAEQFDSEYECRTAIVKLRPNDSAAIKDLKDAAARLTMGKAGWQKAETYRDVLRPDEPRPVMADELGSLTERLAEEPQNIEIRKQLADAQLLKNQYDEAIANLNICLEQASSPDPQLERKLHLAQEHQIRFAIATAEDAGDRNQVSRLKNNLADQRIKNAARHVSRYPNDLNLKFDYGKLLIESGKYNEAIQQFQHAQRNPQRRIRSLIYLAQAFHAKGQLDIAREQLESALAELTIMNDSKKEVLYQLGILCEEENAPEKAKGYFKQIYAVDIGYLDVAAKMDAL